MILHSRLLNKFFLFVACATWIAACEPESPDEHQHDDMNGDMDFSSSQTSSDGAFFIMYTADPDPIPLDQNFNLTFMVHDGEDHNTILEDVESLSLDATMPGHGHGMNTTPTVTKNENGTFAVEGMLFHMEGHWKVTVETTRSGTTEDTTFNVNCCKGS